MCEAMSMGVDDVLILGVDVSSENYGEVVQFLSEIDASAQDCSVGIAVNAGVFLLTEDEIYIAGALLGASDYVSLDLRGLSFERSDATGNKDELEKKMLSEYLFNMKYYLSAYSARLVFSEQNKEFFSLSRELGYGNVQVVCE